MVALVGQIVLVEHIVVLELGPFVVVVIAFHLLRCFGSGHHRHLPSWSRQQHDRRQNRHLRPFLKPSYHPFRTSYLRIIVEQLEQQLVLVVL